MPHIPGFVHDLWSSGGGAAESEHQRPIQIIAFINLVSIAPLFKERHAAFLRLNSDPEVNERKLHWKACGQRTEGHAGRKEAPHHLGKMSSFGKLKEIVIAAALPKSYLLLLRSDGQKSTG